MANRKLSFRLGASLFLAIAVTAGAIGQSSKNAPVKSIRLYVFDGGKLDVPDTAPYRMKKEDLATTYMSVASFLVVHPKGTLMWDTGAVPDASITAGGGHGTIRYASATKTLESQLAEAGYSPGSINYLALSHFHWDHVGNANLFGHATWLVAKAERDMMFSDPPSTRTEPQNFSALKNAKTILLTGNEYDVFGDGSVVIMAAPGHSPRHQVLFLKLARTGPVMLSGDLYHYPEERKLKLIPTTEFDAEQTAASRASIEAFLKKSGAQLWIQHDFNANAKLRKAPAYYD